MEIFREGNKAFPPAPESNGSLCPLYENHLITVLKDRLQIEPNSREVFGFFMIVLWKTENLIGKFNKDKESSNFLHMHLFTIEQICMYYH